jgi:hypothetical protein
MSGAPPGFNPSETMLPAATGVIHAMKGGGATIHAAVIELLKGNVAPGGSIDLSKDVTIPIIAPAVKLKGGNRKKTKRLRAGRTRRNKELV